MFLPHLVLTSHYTSVGEDGGSGKDEIMRQQNGREPSSPAQVCATSCRTGEQATRHSTIVAEGETALLFILVGTLW